MLHWGSGQYVCMCKWVHMIASVQDNSCMSVFRSAEAGMWQRLCKKQEADIITFHELVNMDCNCRCTSLTLYLYVCCCPEWQVHTASFGLHPGCYWGSQIDAVLCRPSRRHHQLNWWGVSDSSTQVSVLYSLFSSHVKQWVVHFLWWYMENTHYVQCVMVQTHQTNIKGLLAMKAVYLDQKLHLNTFYILHSTERVKIEDLLLPERLGRPTNHHTASVSVW